jgi:hypothetical protein
MATNAVCVDGESQLPQARPTAVFEPVYLNGESGWLPILVYVAGGGQFARPVSDVSVGNWTASTGTDRFAMVDEEAASDADYITSGATPSNDECVLALGAISTPAAGTVTLRVRMKYV